MQEHPTDGVSRPLSDERIVTWTYSHPDDLPDLSAYPDGWTVLMDEWNIDTGEEHTGLYYVKQILKLAWGDEAGESVAITMRVVRVPIVE